MGLNSRNASELWVSPQEVSTPICLIEPDQSQLVAPLEREEKDAAEALLVEQVGIPPMLYSGQVSQISPLKEMEFLSGKI